MKKIIDYQIIQGIRTEVERRVKDAIINGWQPYGDIKFGSHGKFENIYQVIVKYDIDSALGDNF